MIVVVAFVPVTELVGDGVYEDELDFSPPSAGEGAGEAGDGCMVTTTIVGSGGVCEDWLLGDMLFEIEEAEDVDDVVGEGVGFGPGVVPFSRPGSVIVASAAGPSPLFAEIEDVGCT